MGVKTCKDKDNMGIVNVRIPDDLKKKMENHSELNWSEIIREAIQSRVTAEESKRKDWARVRVAIEGMDRIAETLARRYKGPWNGTEVVRYWREHRYSSSTRR